MTEKDKMLNGELYSPEEDITLYNERLECKKLCHKYNNISPEEINERNVLIKKLLGKTGNKYWIEQPFYCDYGYNIEVGENFYSNHNLVILDCAKVKIGNNVFIGPNCGIYTAEHPIDTETRNKGLEFAKPITIGNNVWIGGGVTIVAGVTIGNNVVIAAGAVVTKDIPDNCVVAGVPAKQIKSI